MTLVAVGAMSACTPGDSRTAAPSVGSSRAAAGPATAARQDNGEEAAEEQRADPEGDGYPPLCTAADLLAAIAPGESGTPTTWQSAIVVTSRRTEACVLEGASQVEFRTGGSGTPLGIDQVTDASAEPATVVLAGGDQASMGVTYDTSFADPVPGGCLTDGHFADVVLPGNEEIVEAWFPDRRLGLPPVCGAVRTGAWQEGGAPGVAPN